LCQEPSSWAYLHYSLVSWTFWGFLQFPIKPPQWFLQAMCFHRQNWILSQRRAKLVCH
jgi:hypothetical protein